MLSNRKRFCVAIGVWSLLPGALLVVLLFVTGSVEAQATWTQVGQGPVLQPGAPGTWDARTAHLTSVVRDGDTYWASYTGWDLPQNATFAVGFATSNDLLTWAKVSPLPVLSGQPGIWEGRSIYGAKVLADPAGGGFNIWYSANDGNAVCSIGFATSPDGMLRTTSSLFVSSSLTVQVGPAA